MAEFELDHIGIAVDSLSEGFAFYQALGFGALETETVETEKVRVGFLPLLNRANLELLEPTSEDSTIRKYLDKRGPGIHHICLRVKDLDSVVKKLKAAGVRLINEIPRKGAHDCRVVFVHPASAGGVLFELSQPPPGAAGSAIDIDIDIDIDKVSGQATGDEMGPDTSSSKVRGIQ